MSVDHYHDEMQQMQLHRKHEDLVIIQQPVVIRWWHKLSYVIKNDKLHVMICEERPLANFPLMFPGLGIVKVPLGAKISFVDSNFPWRGTVGFRRKWV